jgi:hypothetical protein
MNTLLLIILLIIILIIIGKFFIKKKKIIPEKDPVRPDPVIELSGSSGHMEKITSPAVGDSLMIFARGLNPSAAHEIELSDVEGVLFTSRLMTNKSGEIPESVLWPQFGLDDPRTNKIYTVEVAE